MALQTKTFTTGDYAYGSWSNGYQIALKLTEESTNTANNTSVVSYLFTISNTDNNRFISNDYSWTISIGDQSIAINHFNFNLGSNNMTQTIASGQVIVTHGADGTINMPYNVSIPNIQNWNRYGPPAMSLSGTWALTTIQRKATLQSTPNFTDEENPTITYKNPAGTAASTLRACICSVDGKTIYAPYRDISKTGSTYTFSLTDAERTALQNATPNSNTMNVNFTIKTVVGGSSLYHTVTRTLTIANAAPVVSINVVDTKESVVVLTGNANRIVSGISVAKATASYTIKKGASLSSLKITVDGKTYTTNPVTVERPASNDFSVTVTDSRGNTTTKTPSNVIWVPYICPTCVMGNNRIDTSGKLTLKASGQWFNGSFGSVANTVTVKYRYKTAGGSYGSWTSMTVSKSGNTYAATASLSGLNYQTAYVFQAQVTDKWSSVETAEQNVKSFPVFDWSESDFQFHVPVKLVSTQDIVTAQGTSGGWTYRKWNSGVAECFYSSAVTPTSGAGSKYHSVTLPFTFSNANYYVGLTGTKSAHANYAHDFLVGDASSSEGRTTTTIKFSYQYASGTPYGVGFTIYVMGRWK